MNASEIYRNIKLAFEEDSIDERIVRWWFQKFDSGNENLENESRGRPKSVLNEDKRKAKVELDWNDGFRAFELRAHSKAKKLEKWAPAEEGLKIERERHESIFE